MESEIIEKFYQNCLTTASKERLKKIKWVMESTRGILKKDLTKLNHDDVVTFLVFINQSDFSPWSKNDFKKIFKRFLKWHYKDLEMIGGDKVKEAFKTISSRKCMNKEKINKDTLVKAEELEKLIRTAKTLKWKALISFAYESAFRPCEINVLRWKDLVFDDNMGICKVNLVSSPKTEETRRIPIKDCVVHLKRWREEYQFPNRSQNDLVFPSQHDSKKPMGRGVISEMFRRICIEAKMRQIYPYLLRHSRICELQIRLPEKIVAKFSGHSIETSELYNHITDDEVTDTLLKEIYVTKELPTEKKHAIELKMEKMEEVFTKRLNEMAATLERTNERLLKLKASKK